MGVLTDSNTLIGMKSAGMLAILLALIGEQQIKLYIFSICFWGHLIFAKAHNEIIGPVCKGGAPFSPRQLNGKRTTVPTVA